MQAGLYGIKKFPAVTYSRAFGTTMGPGCLTAVFGMGTGVATWVWSPGKEHGYQEGMRKVLSA